MEVTNNGNEFSKCRRKFVKQVLESMLKTPVSAAPAAASKSQAIPETAHVAMLTALEHYEIKEFPMPEVGDGDILVKVEGCGVCGTDAHEFKRDPFGLIPVALGHEGTGEIVKMGKNVKGTAQEKPVRVGDKIVTCMIFKDDPDIDDVRSKQEEYRRCGRIRTSSG